MLAAIEAKLPSDRIDVKTPVGLRNRALIALTAFFVPAVDAMLALRGEDVDAPQRRLCVQLHEKGGKDPEIPCDHEEVEQIHLSTRARMGMLNPAR